jgi:hypothetical protein
MAARKRGIASMTIELTALSITVFVLSLYAAWSFGRQRMASTLAVVRQQNEELLKRITQLECDRDHDRLLISNLRTDNDAMRLKQSEMEKNVASLENSLRLTNQEKNYWHQRADELGSK